MLAKGVKRGRKTGRKAELSAAAQRRAEARRTGGAAAPGGRRSAPEKPAEQSAAAGPLLAGEGKRPRGLAIDRLGPPAVEPAADLLLWCRAMLPAGFRDVRRGRALAGLLDRLPQLAFDPDLSIPVAARLPVHLDLLRETGWAAARGWPAMDDRAAVEDAILATYEATGARASAPASPTHADGLARSTTALALGLVPPRRRRPPGDPADQNHLNHYARARRRMEALLALTPMACGLVGREDPVSGAEPIVGKAVFRRYLDRLLRFQSDTDPEAVAERRRRAVDGPWWAGRPPSELALLKRRANHGWRVAQADLLRRLWAADRAGLRAFHASLKLAGSLQDVARERFSMTPADAALMLKAIAARAIGGLRAAAVATFDAHDSGWPHVHVVLVVDAGDIAALREGLVEAYAAFGMDLGGGEDLDEDLACLTAVEEATSGQWHYGIGNEAPSAVPAAELLRFLAEPMEGLAEDERRKRGEEIRRHRMDAWRRAHGIPRGFDIGLANLVTAKRVGRTPLGTHPVVGAAKAMARVGNWELELLLAVRAAPRLMPVPAGGHIAGSRPAGPAGQVGGAGAPADVLARGQGGRAAAAPGMPPATAALSAGRDAAPRGEPVGGSVLPADSAAKAPPSPRGRPSRVRRPRGAGAVLHVIEDGGRRAIVLVQPRSGPATGASPPEAAAGGAAGPPVGRDDIRHFRMPEQRSMEDYRAIPPAKSESY